MGFVLYGIDSGDESGYSVSSAGDVNNDGYANLIVGAHQASPAGNSESGETYVVFGNPSFEPEINLADLDGGREAWRYDFATETVSSLTSDINAPIDESTAPDQLTPLDGSLYFAAEDVEHGRVLWRHDLIAEANTLVTAPTSFPDGVPDPGELTADDDQLLFTADDGLTGRELWAYSAAAATLDLVTDDVVPGSGGSDPANLVPYDNDIAFTASDFSYGFVLNGIERSDKSGGSVSTAGDVNSDGYADLIIGAWEADLTGNDRAGETYVVFGGPAGTFPAELDLADLLVSNGGDGSAGFVLYGIDSYDYSGSSVSSAGDVNNDGYDDLIIGAPRADLAGDDWAGETYVVFGGPVGTFPAELNLSDLLATNGGDGSNGFVLQGIDSGDRSGGSVSSAGDIDNDGYADLIIGACGADPAGNSDAGEAYVVFGRARFEAKVNLADLVGSRELWTHNAATETALHVTSGFNAPFGSTRPDQLTLFDGSLYFAAEDLDLGRILWRHDLGSGTTTPVSGTTHFAAGVPDPQGLAVVGDRLFFAAADGAIGSELWTFNPDTTEIELVRDIFDGAGSSTPSDFFFTDGLYYTVADDGATGRELWAFGPTDEYRFVFQASDTVEHIDFGNHYPGTGVVDRHVFYNNSRWDGFDSAANIGDDQAIATDKTPLLPGDPAATFANYTSYSRGINGVMVDVKNLADADELGLDDFEFRVGNDPADPNDWTDAPAPAHLDVRQVGSIDRITLVWADDNPWTAAVEPGAIARQWLQVRLLATERTGLPQDDVFYLGNAIGETGNLAASGVVDAMDEIAVRNNPAFFPPAAIDDRYDFDRDRIVGATDQIIARGNRTFLDALRLIAVPTVVATDDTSAANSDAAAVVDVLANDRDMKGDPLSVHQVDALSEHGASLAINPADNRLTYDPTGSAQLQALLPGETLDDTFSYVIRDASGRIDTGTVIVTITGAAAAPQIADDAQSGGNSPTDAMLADAAMIFMTSESDSDEAQSRSLKTELTPGLLDLLAEEQTGRG